jgi:hypothetical protein
MRVQPLQHMQYPDLLLQHPSKTLATYLWNIWNTWNICLQHVFSAKHGSQVGALHSKIRLCDRGGEEGWQRAGGYAGPGERLRCPPHRVHPVPLATGAPRWRRQQQPCGCSLAWRGGSGCAGATTVERKACGRCGGAGGRVQSRLREFFLYNLRWLMGSG